MKCIVSAVQQKTNKINIEIKIRFKIIKTKTKH